MEKAITIAIENGYKLSSLERLKEKGFGFSHFDEQMMSKVLKFEVLLDPLFWQALGKGLGWAHACSHGDYCDRELEWKEEWHRFIDHLAEGKDIESFFTNLQALGAKEV